MLEHLDLDLTHRSTQNSVTEIVRGGNTTAGYDGVQAFQVGERIMRVTTDPNGVPTDPVT